jgi:DNA modification methylase
VKPYYEHAGITIYHGDCREILPQLKYGDLVLTDPYGLRENAYRVASRGKLARTTDYGNFDWDKKPADEWCISVTLAAAPQTIIWGGNYFGLPPARGWLVWDKINGDNCFADCELAWTNLPMSVRLFRHMWNGMLRESEPEPRVHPAQKPVALMKWCLRFVPEAKVIIDPFMGSGTTLRAAKDEKVQAIGIDLEERYCEIAAKRMGQEVLAL